MLNQIKHGLADFSPAEQRVAKWVLAHPKQAAESTLADVASGCGTSEPTVIRFCRHVGLGGFRELAIRLTEALSRPISYVHRDVSADDSIPDAVTKVLDASVQSLIDIRSRLSSMPIEQAVNKLRLARQIVFAGLGASGHVASDACHKFFRLGTPCSTLTDSPSILQFASVAQAKDVLVITSHSGNWPELSQAAQIARNNGACVIALTAPNSALAQEAEIVFNCDRREDTGVYTPMSSRLAELALFDALHVSLALALGDNAVDKLRRSKRALEFRGQFT